MKIIQLMTETAASRKQLHKQVKEHFCDNETVINNLITAIDFLRKTKFTYDSKNKRYNELSIGSEAIAYELCTNILLLDGMVTIQSIATKLGSFLDYKHLLDGVRTAAEIIAVCEGDLYTLYHANHPDNVVGTLGVVSNYTVDSEFRESLENIMYLPPMINVPNKWVNNNKGGYLKNTGSVILGKNNNHNDEQALDAINTLQRVPWTINTDVLAFEYIKEFKNEKAKKQFKEFTRKSEKVFQYLIDQGNKFYFVWKYDFRGRSYSLGYHCNLQSDGYRKALIQFNREEIING